MMDPDRNYLWESFGSTAHGMVYIAAITIEGIQIPLEYRVDERRDESAPWFDVQLGAFGSSVAGQLDWGLEQHQWDSDAERESAVMVAIEAALAWLPSGLGVERGDGYNRATFRGVQYRLSDFGPYFAVAGVVK